MNQLFVFLDGLSCATIFILFIGIFIACTIFGSIMKRKSMKKVHGIQLGFSTFERGLWWDSDKQNYQPVGFGIKIALLCGKVLDPVPCIFTKQWWKINPWSEGNVWFVLRIPFVILPFISIAIGRLGFYIGAKAYGVDQPHYLEWARPDEAGEGIEALCLTASIRRTRWI